MLRIKDDLAELEEPAELPRSVKDRTRHIAQLVKALGWPLLTDDQLIRIAHVGARRRKYLREVLEARAGDERSAGTPGGNAAMKPLNSSCD